MAEMNEVDESQRLDTLDARGTWAYPSAAATGHVEVVLPALRGSPNGEERLLVKDFGPHVIGKIETSLNRNPYLKSGPTQNPAAVFRHFVAVAKGANLMDSGAIGRMEKLAEEFETEPEQGEYFNQVIKPYLLSLAPKRKG